MGSTAGAITLFIVLLVLLAGAFVGFWIRDKRRADEEAHDLDRIANDPARGDLGSRTAIPYDEGEPPAPQEPHDLGQEAAHGVPPGPEFPQAPH